jgi:hypothetical protein
VDHAARQPVAQPQEEAPSAQLNATLSQACGFLFIIFIRFRNDVALFTNKRNASAMCPLVTPTGSLLPLFSFGISFVF